MISWARVCENERETGRQAGGFTLLIKQTKILNVEVFMGFIVRKYQHSAISAFCLTLLDFPQPHALPLK